MLRRYVIVNGLSTAVMYGAIWAVAPSFTGAIDGAMRGAELYAMDHSWLGPLLHGIVQVSSSVGF